MAMRDTYRGVAIAVDVAVLADLATRFVEHHPNEFGDNWEQFEGDGGMTALLVGEPSPADETFARYLARELGARVYLLDFDRHCQATQWFEVDRRDYLAKGAAGEAAKDAEALGRAADEVLRDAGFLHPAEFLERHGIGAPGYEPLPPSPVRKSCVVEGATPAECRPYFPYEKGTKLTSIERGTLASGDVRGDTWECAEKLGGPVYTVRYEPGERWFQCEVDVRGQEKPKLYRTRPSANEDLNEVVSSALGQTTPEAIIDALGIPREPSSAVMSNLTIAAHGESANELTTALVSEPRQVGSRTEPSRRKTRARVAR